MGGLIDLVKDALKWTRGKMPSTFEQAEQHQREIQSELKDAQHRLDGLQMLVRGMRRKEDWFNGKL